ncbi:MAG: hypothetical protein WC846_01335 [Candidatus Gracilibacteria bacterium]|jgi:hypothetical protein
MISQVSFTADQELKNLALLKAKSQGITLKALLTYAMRGFVDGKISLTIDTSQQEPEVEELFFEDKKLNMAAKKLAKLLR